MKNVSLFRYLRRLARLPIRFDAFEVRMDRQENAMREQFAQQEGRIDELRRQTEALLAGHREVLVEVRRLRQELAPEDGYLPGRLDAIGRTLRHALRRVEQGAPWRPDDPELAQDPEFGLMATLRTYVPSRVALDVGANAGRLSELLLDIGYVVHAFEPAPAVARQLDERLGSRPDFFLHACALGSRPGTLPLHLAEGGADTAGDVSLYSTFHPHPFQPGLAFTGTVEVPVKSLADLVAQGAIPPDFGLLKIDTEGHELEVVRGLGSLRPAIVVAEFWGDEFVYTRGRDPNAPNHPDLLLNEMRALGYWWSLALFRLDGSDEVQYLGNPQRTPARSWGNFFFFRDHEPFRHSADWCDAELPYLAARRSEKSAFAP